MAGAMLHLLLLAGSLIQSTAGHKHQRRHRHMAHHGHKEHLHHGHGHSASVVEVHREMEHMNAFLMKAESELIVATNFLRQLARNSTLKNSTASLQSSTANASSSGFLGKKSNSTSKSTVHHLSKEKKAALHTQADKLQDLFKHLKLNIADFNKRETESKHSSQKMVDKIKKRLEEDRARLKEKNMSTFEHDLLVNRTRMEEREVKYWSRGRELQHNMFHSNLKLTHGLMARVKQVMEAYTDVLKKGFIDPKLSQALKSTAMSLPRSFLQRQLVLEQRVRRYGKHLRKARKLLAGKHRRHQHKGKKLLV